MHRLLDRVSEEGADMLKTYLVNVCPDFWVVSCSPRIFFEFFESPCKKHMRESFSITSDQPMTMTSLHLGVCFDVY